MFGIFLIDSDGYLRLEAIAFVGWRPSLLVLTSCKFREFSLGVTQLLDDLLGKENEALWLLVHALIMRTNSLLPYGRSGLSTVSTTTSSASGEKSQTRGGGGHEFRELGDAENWTLLKFSPRLINLLAMASNLLVNSNGLQPTSNGLRPSSNGSNLDFCMFEA